MLQFWKLRLKSEFAHLLMVSQGQLVELKLFLKRMELLYFLYLVRKQRFEKRKKLKKVDLMSKLKACLALFGLWYENLNLYSSWEEILR